MDKAEEAAAKSFEGNKSKGADKRRAAAQAKAREDTLNAFLQTAPLAEQKGRFADPAKSYRRR